MRNSVRLSRFLCCIFFTSVSAYPGLGSCYYPGGDWAPQNYPCDPYAYTTLCCPLGWSCYYNLICVITDPDYANASYPVGTSIRGTCTNPLWNDTACGDFCLNDPVSDNHGLLNACGDDTFCCAPDAEDGLCDCDTGQGTFSLPLGNLQTILGVTSTTYTYTPPVVLSSSSSESEQAWPTYLSTAAESTSWPTSTASSPSSIVQSPTSASALTPLTSPFIPTSTLSATSSISTVPNYTSSTFSSTLPSSTSSISSSSSSTSSSSSSISWSSSSIDSVMSSSSTSSLFPSSSSTSISTSSTHSSTSLSISTSSVANRGHSSTTRNDRSSTSIPSSLSPSRMVTTTPSSTSLESIGALPATTTSESFAVSPPTSSQARFSLSPAAKAGIAVGVILAAALLVALLWFCLTWQRKRKQGRGGPHYRPVQPRPIDPPLPPIRPYRDSDEQSNPYRESTASLSQVQENPVAFLGGDDPYHATRSGDIQPFSTASVPGTSMQPPHYMSASNRESTPARLRFTPPPTNQTVASELPAASVRVPRRPPTPRRIRPAMSVGTLGMIPQEADEGPYLHATRSLSQWRTVGQDRTAENNWQSTSRMAEYHNL